MDAPPDVVALAEARATARGDRDFAAADRVRDEIAAVGWGVVDTADGFTLQPLRLPLDAQLFVDHVVPLLQRRGLARTEYATGTLRDRLGLPRPAARSSVARQVPA